jgi:hypothetical protein
MKTTKFKQHIGAAWLFLRGNPSIPLDVVDEFKCVLTQYFNENEKCILDKCSILELLESTEFLLTQNNNIEKKQLQNIENQIKKIKYQID